ncbi:serine/threonine protein kinase (plasmid) [Gemmatirosa kalamazoonensis]|uniref:Serine/threonine protein kinase n=1 Tax=Gemmatirosa kalamazoonensis TaxID=861299 RepID=W0RRY5_9BACT|nr:hypothetical protein [Gemmatirosa kalamazoonensis]AHG93471.1 serine/threonine protein kinase [Gemmatirosa kalamazoonensis]
MYEQTETWQVAEPGFGPPDVTLERRGPPRYVGEYELQALLTRYPGADVMHAFHLPTGAPRVLYVLRPAAMQDPASVQRVTDELDLARRLAHPSFPTVDPWGRTSSGRVFFAIEHRRGPTLREIVTQFGRLEPERLMRIGKLVVDALEEAHALGLFHGGLTPDSILLEWSADRRDESVSVLGIGTDAIGRTFAPHELPFLSPEYVAGRALDARSDVFSLASLLQFARDQAPPPSVSDVSEPPRRGGRRRRAARGADSAPDARTTAEVLAAARSADPQLRPPSVKALWEQFVAAEDPMPMSAAEPEPLPSPAILELSIDADTPRWMTEAALAAQVPWTELDEWPNRPTAAAVTSDVSGDVDAERRWSDVLAPLARRRLAAALVSAGVLIVATAALRGAGSPEPAPREISAVAAGTLALRATPSARPAADASPRVQAAVARDKVAVDSSPRAPDHVAEAAADRTAASTEDTSRASVLSSHLDSMLAGAPRVDGTIPDLHLEAPSPSSKAVVRNEEFAAAAESLWRRGRDDTASAASRPDAARVAEARRDAQQAVDAFAIALSTRDLAALSRAVPYMPEKERAQWAKVFHNAKRIDARLTVLDTKFDGDVIAATVQSRIEITLNGVRDHLKSDATSLATLVRDSSGWRLRTSP